MHKALMKAWASITEPRHIKIIYFCVYVVTTFIGIAALSTPPEYVIGELGPILTVIWATLLIMAGISGGATVFTGWWWVERLSILMAIVGVAIYAAVIITVHFNSEVPRLTTLGFLTLAALLYIVRYSGIRKYSFEPRG